MGAGVAAGPHCPFAETQPGRRGVPRRAVSSGGAWTGGPGAASSGVLFQPKPEPVSPRAPRPGPKPWRFAVRRFGTHVPLPPIAVPLPKLWSRWWRDPRPKPRVPPDGHGPKSWGRRFSQLPGRNPVLPGKSGAEAPSFPVASPGPKSRFPPGWSWTRRSGVLPVVSHVPEGRLETNGRFRSLPLSHPLKDKPAASAWRRLRQPPCLSLPPALPPEGDRPGFYSGCGWEGFPPLPGDRLGHPGKVSWKV